MAAVYHRTTDLAVLVGGVVEEAALPRVMAFDTAGTKPA